MTNSPLPRLVRQIRSWLPGSTDERPPEELAETPPPAAPTPEDDGQAAVPPADLAALEKQIAKLGREQYKLNALIEAQHQQAQVALQRLQEQDERRERERADLLARRDADQVEARLAVIQRLLPVLDGLDEALALADKLLEDLPPHDQPRPRDEHRRPRSWGRRLVVGYIMLLGQVFPALLRRSGQGAERTRALQSAPDPEWAAWKASYLAWLRGLEMVRERLLGALAAEGAQPIKACGCPFDPHFHTALGTSPAGPDAPPGVVVEELSRGYAVGDRVLRYAEVVVARPVEQASTTQETVR
jgi:molecular chaperone GrpE (heat shock protein)